MGLSERFADAVLLGLLALAFVVVGVPMLTVGLLILGFGGTHWVTVAGFAILASGGALLWALRRTQLRARCARVARPGPTRAFISYRTAEHGAYVHRIAAALRAHGIVVHLAPSEAMAPDPKRSWTAFRAIGLFQTGELDADLQQALLDSDALVYCVPSSRRELTFGRFAKDTADSLLAQLLFQGGASAAFWRYAWQMGVYGKQVSPAARLLDLESWQDWELRTARELGLEVIPVVLGSDAADAKGVCLRPDALEADVSERVLPKLAGVRRPPPEPEGILPFLAMVLLLFAAVAGVLLLVLLSAAGFFLIGSLF
jgi:hypothetical protein